VSIRDEGLEMSDNGMSYVRYECYKVKDGKFLISDS